MRLLFCTLLLFRLIFPTVSQQITTTDTLGQSIVQVVTTNPAGVPTTQIIQTLVPTTTSSTAIAPATTLPDIPQGPVGQPPHTTGPAPPTVYQYTTTDAQGDTIVLQDTFTPTYLPSVQTIVPASGTVLGYSEWLSMIGTSTVAPASSSTPRWQLPTPFTIFAVLASSLMGGALIVFF